MSKRAHNFKDLTGQKFGKLTVIKYIFTKFKQAYFLCKCDCGKEKTIRGNSLKNGMTKSCGCLFKTLNLKHKMSYTRFYKIWISMKKRCLNKNDINYKNYGARGIKVCNRWRKFENFKDDMYALYLGHCKEFGEKQTTIDRIDVNGNYELNNCRFVTILEQHNNMRRNHLITFNGKTQNLKQWAKELNIKYTTLFGRINNYGWTIKKALTHLICNK